MGLTEGVAELEVPGVVLAVGDGELVTLEVGLALVVGAGVELEEGEGSTTAVAVSNSML